jgi:hypothetical protein
VADPMPPLKMKRSPCIQCGARTERQAETMCKQTLGHDDEYHCAGEFDGQGWSVRPTPESIQRLDDWCSREAQRNDG